MAETVGQHSVAAFTSPVNGTTPIDANTVRGNDNTVRAAYVDHDADPGIHVQSSSLASRPVAGTAGRKWITVNSGRYQLWYDDGSRWHEVASDAVNVDCLADANLTKGDVVKITGFNNGQNLPTVNKVTASTDTAFGVVENTVTSGNLVQIVNTGLIEDVDTNGYAVGTILYPNTSGGWTSTKPTSGNYQPAGYVLRGNTNNGVLYVEFSAPRIVERSDNTASTVVLRDASGNFSAGTITAGAVTSTGLVTFASLKGTGATTVTNILDEDNMASDSATALATQQSIKAYVDSKVATVDTLAEVLANGNTTGANNIIVTNGQKITTNTIDETTAAAGVTIDSVLLKDNAVTATTFNGTLNGAAPAGSLSGTTLASNVTASSLTSVGTLANLTVTNPITGSVTGSSGSTTGNAATATALQTARNINGVSFNGTADITVTAAAGTLTGTTLASGVTASSLTSVGTLSSLTVSGNTYVATTSGNLGVGTTSTSAKIHAFSASGSSALYLQNGTATTGKTWKVDSFSDGNLYIGIPAVIDALSITPAGNLAVDTNTLYVDATNNRVGVGTASPDVTLDLEAAAGSSTALVMLKNTSGASASNIAQMQFWSGNTFGGLEQIASIHGINPNAGSNNGGTLVFSTSSNGTATTPTERARIDSSGNLGVGTTSPQTKLHVAGEGAFWATGNDAFRVVPLTAGSGSKFLSTNSANNAYAPAIIDGSIVAFQTSGSERARITSAGALIVGNGGSIDAGGASTGDIIVSAGAQKIGYVPTSTGNRGYLIPYDGSGFTHLFNSFATGGLLFSTNGSERARITSGGVLLVGKAASNIANNGSEFNQSGACQFTTAAEPVMYINRQTDDGDLIRFFQASTQEGSISVSGATVSYNAFAGSHWSQLEDGSKPEILRGTVMEAINELCGWPDETNERLPKAKVSDTAGSKKVYGVFMDWDNDWTETNDMLITSVGAFICRVAADVVVEQGDLLESNGDGTARVQADDVIRSSTIGKVTSTVKTHQYDDGTYCVPTVLYCG